MASEAPSFTSHREIHHFAGILFDLDGTLIDSTDAIVKHWHRQVLGKELGVDPNVILQTSHGRRSIDTLAVYDQNKANWEYVSYVEGLIPKEFGQDAQEVPGARTLLADLEAIDAPWGIVTSGTRALMTGWLQVMKLASPKIHVVAEDVQKGKPDPACYELGIQRLSLQPATGAAILVIEGLLPLLFLLLLLHLPLPENASLPSTFQGLGMLTVSCVSLDAPAGIRAGKAAGCQVIGLATTHSIDQIKAAGADWIVRDLRSVQLVGHTVKDGRKVMEIAIANSLLLQL